MGRGGLPDKDLLQGLVACQLGKSRIGHLRAIQIEIFELLQTGELCDAGIAYLGVFQVQAFKVWKLGQRRDASVRDLAARQIDPHHMRGNRGDFGQLLIAEFVSRVDHAEALLVIVLRQWHEAGVDRLKLFGHRSDGFLFVFAQWLGLRLFFSLALVGDRLGSDGFKRPTKQSFNVRCLFRRCDGESFTRAFGDPPLQQRDFCLGELRLVARRHVLIVVVRQGDTNKGEAVIRLASHDRGRAIAATLHRVCKGVHPQLALGLLGTVAADALGFQNRQHHIFEDDGLASGCEIKLCRGCSRANCGRLCHSSNRGGSHDGHWFCVVLGRPADVDVRGSERLLQGCNAVLRDGRLPEVERLQLRQATELGEPCVGDFGAVEIQILKTGQAFYMIQSCIANTGVLQVQLGQIFHPGETRETRIRDLRAC